MKKLLLLIIAPLAFFAAVQAQITPIVTQAEADGIVLERLNKETQSSTVYLKEGLPEKMMITSSAGEQIELNYLCRVYYIRYTDTNQGRYLIVNVNNGNLLEVNIKSDTEPVDMMEKWRIEAPVKEISFTEYVLESPSCRWIQSYYNRPPGYDYSFGSEVVVINNNEELEKNVTCQKDGFGNCINPCVFYSTIDFSKYTLLLAHGVEPYQNRPVYTGLQQLSTQSYVMRIRFNPSGLAALLYWQVPILVSKIADGSTIEVICTFNRFNR